MSLTHRCAVALADMSIMSWDTRTFAGQPSPGPGNRRVIWVSQLQAVMCAFGMLRRLHARLWLLISLTVLSAGCVEPQRLLLEAARIDLALTPLAFVAGALNALFGVG